MSETIEGGGIFASAVNRKISRRSFLKWSAAIGATTSASGLILSAATQRAKADPMYGSVAPASGSDVVQWIPTHCLVCHSWCALAVGLDANLCVRKIEGLGGQPKTNASTNLGEATDNRPGVNVWEHKEDCNYTESPKGYLPYAFHNRGRICAKGNAGMQHLYDPDRVKYPLERLGDRGSGRWRRVTWEYAIAKIAMVLRELGKAGYKVNSLGNLVQNRNSGQWLDIDGGWRPESEAGQDLRHRFVFYAGRNESDGAGRFTGAYGTPNHIEHTSLCESSRHGAQLHMMQDKFPIPDLSTHCTLSGHYAFSGSPSFNPPGVNPQHTRDLDSSDDTDFMLEFGGNPCEVKIPSASYSVRWTDRRRDGYNDGGSGLNHKHNCRMVVVDPRQSNTAAFADEWICIIPGTDGALAAAIIYEMAGRIGRSGDCGDDTGDDFTYTPTELDTGFDILRRRLDGFDDAGAKDPMFFERGHIGPGLNGGFRKYLGFFASEVTSPNDIEEGDNPSLVPGEGDWNAVAWNLKAGTWSVENYVRGAFLAADAPSVPGPGGGATSDIAFDEAFDLGFGGDGVNNGNDPKGAQFAAWVCFGKKPGDPGYGDAVTTVKYLASALAGEADYMVVGNGGTFADCCPIPEYHNPSIDGYRGPAKHSNGVYAYKLIRALETLAGSKKGGAVDRPGTHNHGAGGSGGLYGAAVAGMSIATGSASTARAVQLPDTAGIGQFRGDGGEHGGGGGPSNGDAAGRIDHWDYEHGKSKFHLVTHKTDQMVVPGIRASLGLHPFKEGNLTQLNRGGIYTSAVTATADSGSGYDITVADATGFVAGQTALWLDDGAAGTATDGVQLGEIVTVAGNVVTVSRDVPGGHLGHVNRRLVTDQHSWAATGTDRRLPYVKEDSTFKVEALMIFKNGVGNTRANIKLDQELAVKKIGGQYALKHLWSIDMCMGDYSRFADIILPDTSYLERYDSKDGHEGPGLKRYRMTRQPVLRWTVDTYPVFLYNARPINIIVWMLARAIEGNWYYSDNSGVGYFGGMTTPWQAKLGGAGIAPWNGNLFDQFDWEGWDYTTNAYTGGNTADWNLAHEGYGASLADDTASATNRFLPGLTPAGAHVDPATASAAEKFRWLKVNGFWFHALQKANLYGRTIGVAVGGAIGAILAYNDYFSNLDGVINAKNNDKLTGRNQTRDPSFVGNTLVAGDQNFMPSGVSGGLGGGAGPNGKPWPFPVYVPLTQQTDATYPLHLTTYKLNVHTQSRTTSVPRLTEIIGNNWAVMNKKTGDAYGIVNGDTVKVQTQQGNVELEAKVTPKVCDDIVAISNSFGHEVAGEANIPQWNPGDTPDQAEAFGLHLVSDPSEGVLAPGPNRQRGAGMYPTCLDPYTKALPPSAPGRGRHPNHAIRRVAGTGQLTGEMAMCPVGGSLGWFDSKCWIIKE